MSLIIKDVDVGEVYRQTTDELLTRFQSDSPSLLFCCYPDTGFMSAIIVAPLGFMLGSVFNYYDFYVALQDYTLSHLARNERVFNDFIKSMEALGIKKNEINSSFIFPYSSFSAVGGKARRDFCRNPVAKTGLMGFMRGVFIPSDIKSEFASYVDAQCNQFGDFGFFRGQGRPALGFKLIRYDDRLVDLDGDIVFKTIDCAALTAPPFYVGNKSHVGLWVDVLRGHLGSLSAKGIASLNVAADGFLGLFDFSVLEHQSFSLEGFEVLRLRAEMLLAICPPWRYRRVSQQIFELKKLNTTLNRKEISLIICLLEKYIERCLSEYPVVAENPLCSSVLAGC